MQAVDFPTYLRQAMAAVRLGQADLARASGIGEAQISRWLRGQNQPDLPNLRRLAKPLGRPLLELLVASGHLEPREAQMKDVPSAPDLVQVDVVTAIREDADLDEKGKYALTQHYAGLVLFERQRRALDSRESEVVAMSRGPSRRKASAAGGRTASASGQRAVASGGTAPKDAEKRTASERKKQTGKSGT